MLSRFLIQAAACPKISEIFDRAIFACGAIFSVIYLSLAIDAAARWNVFSGDGESISFRIYRLVVSFYAELYAPPSRRADSRRELNEAKNPVRLGTRATKQSLEIF